MKRVVPRGTIYTDRIFLTVLVLANWRVRVDGEIFVQEWPALRRELLSHSRPS